MVDKVTSKLDLKVYTVSVPLSLLFLPWKADTARDMQRKRIRKPEKLSRDKTAMKSFENELHNLKRLQHRHLINFVGYVVRVL